MTVIGPRPDYIIDHTYREQSRDPDRLVWRIALVVAAFASGYLWGVL